MKRKGGFFVNPGRPPTPIGGDGIEPYSIVPHYVSARLASELRKRRIEFELRCGAKEDIWRHGPVPGHPVPGVPVRVSEVDAEAHDDRFTFPRGDAIMIQHLLNSIEFDAGW